MPPIHIIRWYFSLESPFWAPLGRRGQDLCSRTPKPPPEVLLGCRPVHHSRAPLCSPSLGNLCILKTGNSPFNIFCLRFRYTLLTPQTLQPQTLEAKSSPLSPNTSLPRNSGQKGRKPEGRWRLVKGKQDMQGKNINQYFKTQIPPCL